MRPAEAPALALVAGLAVRQVVAALGIAPVLVKWPNDVIVGKRKIAGVLVESHLRGERLDTVIVGIGVNVTTRDFGPELRDYATSLALEGIDAVDRVELLASLLADLEQRLDAWSEPGLDSVVEEFRRHDALRGVPLRVGNVTGIGAGLDETGALLVSDAAGTTHALTAGSVVLL
jgi:BirA family biotin operon repressor/biotin-[acetyl-CoA-carboxylase] ligase